MWVVFDHDGTQIVAASFLFTSRTNAMHDYQYLLLVADIKNKKIKKGGQLG